MIPIRTDRQLQQRPWVNYGIIAMNVFVFVVLQRMSSSGAGVSQYMLHADQPQVFQFFSSMFMHASWSHLLGNMIFLWVFGNILDDYLGHVAYLTFYLAGGVIAGAGYIVLGGSGQLLGASGAISAVTGAFLVLFPRVRVTVLMILIYIWYPMEIASWIFLLLQFVWNVYASAANFQDNVAYAAHSSGYLFGIVVAVGLLALRLLPSEPYDLLNLFRTWRRRTSYRRVVASGYDPFGRGPGRVSEASRPRRADKPKAKADLSHAEYREAQLREEIAACCARDDYDGAANAYLRLVQLADDPTLPLAEQLDVANILMTNEQYAASADAYERFLTRYGRYEHIGDIRLLLGLIYGRYLRQYDLAERYLARAIPGLLDEGKVAMARDELATVRRHLGR